MNGWTKETPLSSVPHKRVTSKVTHTQALQIVKDIQVPTSLKAAIENLIVIYENEIVRALIANICVYLTETYCFEFACEFAKITNKLRNQLDKKIKEFYGNKWVWPDILAWQEDEILVGEEGILNVLKSLNPEKHISSAR